MGVGRPASRSWGCAVLSIRRMTLGSGYRYLMESVAAGDGVRQQTMSLADYYAASGTPPGVFLGAGLAALDGGRGVEIGSEVSEQHLFNLLGMCADPISGRPWGIRRSARSSHRPRSGGRTGAIGSPSTSPGGSSRRPVTKPRFGTRPALPDAGGRLRPHLLSQQVGLDGMGLGRPPTPRRRSMPVIAGPSRSCSPTPSARSSTRARGETAWSKRTSRVWWLLPSPTGIRGPATPSSMTMWWWPTGPGRSPTGCGARSTRVDCSRAWSCSESCTRVCWPTC